MKKIRAAVIGTGYLGQYHAEKYAARPDVELVAVVDPDCGRASAVADKCGTSACGSHAELLGRVDAVSIVTPTPTHFDIGRDFLSHGADVLMEKPVTVSLEEADTLIGLAARKGLILQVGHLERFNPAVKALSAAVAAPFYIEARRMSVFKPRAADTSVVLDLMIHDLDIVSSLVKSKVKSISATGTRLITDKPDLASARITYENGAVADITASRLALADDRKMSVFSRDAWFYVDFAERILKAVKPGNPRWETTVAGQSFEKADALAEEIAAFVESIKTRKPPLVTGEVAREALASALSVDGMI
ncbi:MAG: Gfo/Idh/MocA family oxidoreductase [Deltaproteobacteria bacterium]|nr:Gfo/Idh/MocA family oxidoreductase [Deltaproteobacteria bacterium]